MFKNAVFVQVLQSQVVRFEIFQDKRGVIFILTISVPTPLCYLEKCGFCPISPMQEVRFEKFQDKRGLFF